MNDAFDTSLFFFFLTTLSYVVLSSIDAFDNLFKNIPGIVHMLSKKQ